MNVEQNLCEVKIFQPQSMSNTMRCINQRFELKISGLSCLALIDMIYLFASSLFDMKLWLSGSGEAQ